MARKKQTHPVPETPAPGNDAANPVDPASVPGPENTEDVPEEETGDVVAEEQGENLRLREIMDTNFIEYASYVIKERAIPDVDDGLKPVQRRILWTLHRNDDGTFHKVANMVGYTMKFHPHGDASIYDALVVLANKEFFIDRQGNYGSIVTGDSAAAGRYIECRLSKLGREVLFNDSITDLIPSYDGRDVEPSTLPIKIPALLLMGTDGIAVGTNTRIMPHNFNEVLSAQIACLRGEEFHLYPDFLQGGIMDASGYEDGNGKIVLRAKIELEGRILVIREIPALTTTQKLMDSIEKASKAGKIKIAGIQDLTAAEVRIEITPQRGYDPQRAIQALYQYTDCSMPVSLNFMVIRDNRPVQMTVTDVLKRNTEKLLEYLRAELQLESGSLLDKLMIRTLARIFVEERIYKRIEKCKTFELVQKEVRSGLEAFRKEWMPIVEKLRENMLARNLAEKDPEAARRLEQLGRGIIPDEEIDKLLAIPIRRISLFDIGRNREEIRELEEALAQAEKNLKRLKAYAIRYLQTLLDTYGKDFPRRTELNLNGFGKIDMHSVALNNIRVGWDRKAGYVGTGVKSEDVVVCNEYDHLLCVERKGAYRVINIPDKVFIDKLYEFRKYDRNTEFGVVYSDTRTGKVYAKRCVIDKFITDRTYRICPEHCKLEVITSRPQALYECQIDTPIKARKIQSLDLSSVPLRSAHAGGILVFPRKLLKITFVKYLDGTEPETEPPLFPLPPEQTPPAADGGAEPPVSLASVPAAEKPAENPPPAAVPEKKASKKIPEKKPSSSGKTPAPEKKPSGGNADEDENWGITQPGFDF